MNAAQFNAEIARIGKTLPIKKIVPFHKKVCFEALGRIVDKTPVKTGRARGNWQVTVNTKTTTPIENLDKVGGPTISAGMAGLTNLPPYSIVWIANHVPYIIYLEDGHYIWSENGSIQAPQGMLKLTLEELKVIFK